MARITPCLENGKTAQVSILNDGEIGFGSFLKLIDDKIALNDRINNNLAA